MTIRRAHVRTDRRTGRRVAVRAHPVASAKPPAAVADNPPAAHVGLTDPFAPAPAGPPVWDGPGGGTLTAEEFTARFVPSEHGWDWATAARTTTGDRFEVDPDDPVDWDGFVADIAANGLREPVRVHDGVWVVDGHHRTIACMKAGVPIRWEPAPSETHEGQVPGGPGDYLRHVPPDLADELAGQVPDDDDWWAAVAARRDDNLGVVAYDCRDGTVHVTPGVLDEQARDAFLLGGCGALAAAMHRTHGWPLVGLWATDDQPFHVAVLAPDGLVVDIDGAHPPEEWAMAYGAPDDCEYELLSAEETAWVVDGVRDPGEQQFGLPGAEEIATSFVGPVTGLWRDRVRGWIAEAS
jgi:hypothetical protein